MGQTLMSPTQSQ